MSASHAAAAGRSTPTAVTAALSATVTRTAAFAVTLLVLARSGGVGLPVAEAAALAVPYAVARIALPGWAAGYGFRRLATTADIAGGAILAAIALTYREAGWTLVLGALLGAVRGAADLSHESLAASEPPAGWPRPDAPAAGATGAGTGAPAGTATAVGTGGAGGLPAAVVLGAAAAALAGWIGLVGAIWLTVVASAAAALLASPDGSPTASPLPGSVLPAPAGVPGGATAGAVPAAGAPTGAAPGVAAPAAGGPATAGSTVGIPIPGLPVAGTPSSAPAAPDHAGASTAGAQTPGAPTAGAPTAGAQAAGAQANGADPAANGRVYRSVAIDSVVIPVQPGQPVQAADPGALDEPTREVPMYRPLSVRRAGLRGLATAAILGVAGQAGALALAFAWVRGVVGHDAAFGLVAGALVAGAFAGRLASHAGRSPVTVATAAGAGFAAAAGAVIGAAALPAVTIVLVLVAYLAGTVFTAPEPGGEIRVDMSGAPAAPVLRLNTAIGLAFAALPAAALVAAAAARASTVPALLIGGLLFLVGIAWLLGPAGGAAGGRIDGARPDAAAVPVEPVAARLAGVATWVAVTLVYADGGWSVEVERKEGRSEGGHEVRSADALHAIDVLDLPGLRAEIESALAADQQRTEQETVRLREELTTIDEKMAAIREMVAWSEAWQAHR